jgi:alpha-glucosidase
VLESGAAAHGRSRVDGPLAHEDQAAMTWWTRAVFYEVYLRSFQDSNGDGIGDLNGLRRRLSYLADVGVDAVWVTPFYPSPQVDFGYDVSDHEAIDPTYGTLDDFDALVAEAHRLGLRLIIDVVLNHTSDRHRWFTASRSSRRSPRRDWYVWRDGRSDGSPPNNWQSAFGGPAWTFDASTGQWYYHAFYSQQPDLNWRNPAVEGRMFATLKFWTDRGVDGFRLDAVNTLFEDVELRDNPTFAEPRLNLTGATTQDFVYTRGRPEVHGVLRRLRAAVAQWSPEAVLISEAYVNTLPELMRFYGADDEVHLPFNFFLAQVPRRDAELFRRVVDDIENECQGRWPTIVFSNHDIDRACDRYAHGANPDQVALVLATLLLTLRGTPVMYYGEEIAMRTEPPSTLAEVLDPVGRRFWPLYKGRDGVRRPMAWDANGGQFGFTTATPWLAAPVEGAVRNVAIQLASAASVLNYYRALLALRRSTPALHSGAYRALGAAEDVFAYERLHADGDQRVTVVLNLAPAPRAAALSRGGEAHVLLGTHRRRGERVKLAALMLAPLEAILLDGTSQSR